MKEMDTLIAQMNYGKPEKMRSIHEVDAFYRQRCDQYKSLKRAGANNPSAREQLLVLYTELKTAGWVLGKAEKTIIKDTTI